MKTIKLYTEEQIRKTWNDAFSQGMSIDSVDYEPVFFEDHLESLTPIELPSDEQIMTIIHPLNGQMDEYDIGWKSGVQYLRDKIQGGNNEQQ